MTGRDAVSSIPLASMKRLPRFPGFLLTVWLACLALGAAVRGETRPPNVVVILADDQGWADLGIHGNAQARTPHLDALARSGARFEHFYVQPVCSPTRAEFLTGRYFPRTGVRGVDSGRERLNLDETTVADSFKAAGFVTGAFGKWHNGGQGPYHPNARGFDEFYGFLSGHWGWYFDAPLERNGESVRGRGYIADDLTERALEFMAANRARPFFCYLALNTPHSPFSVPDEYWSRWKDADLPMRADDPAREDLTTTRAVLAMNENLDWNVGRVLAQLDALNLTDDTIVVYFSDNGANTARWNAGMKGRKGSVDEGGVRSPLFVRWPRHIAPGTVVRDIAGAIDLHPTLTQLAAVRHRGEKPLDGIDLSPLLLGRSVATSERMIFSHWNGRSSVRTPRFRLDDRGALYDLTVDPWQTRDVAGANAASAAQLRSALTAWEKAVFGTGEAITPSPGQGAPRPVSVDARAIPVGHPVHPATILPAGEGMPQGGVRRSNRFPNCTYFTNWQSTADEMVWNLDVLTAGEYEAIVEYASSAPARSRIELRCGDARLEAILGPMWDPPLRLNEDRVPRQESLLKDFRPLTLGRLRLERGTASMRLRALEVVGTGVGEVYQLTLRRIADPSSTNR